MVFGYFYKIVCVGTLTLHSKKPLDPHILDNYWTLYLPKAL